jgi:isopentenyldiphosphate isomerase
MGMERNRLSDKEEIFDVFNSSMERVGTARRSEVHAKGLWHQTFHCWIVTKKADKAYLLLQHRHPEKDTFPNLLDVSCAGHLKTGELVEDGIRELQEELGLEVAFDALLPCGIFAEEDFLPHNRMDREFCHIFLYVCDKPLTQYHFQYDEIIGLCQVEVEGFEQLLNGGKSNLLAESVYLTEDGQLEESDRYISMEHMVPHEKAYYELIIQALKQ